MPFTVKQARAGDGLNGWLRGSWWLLVPALLALVAAGCASTPTTPSVPLTGNALVDGPNAIQSGPPRDRVLWEYRTAAAAMRQGQFDVARQHLDSALTRLRGIYAPDPSARKARSYFNAEAKKTFIGEPYERAMAYLYRGILYWMDGEPDNARACFRSAELEDSDTEKQEYAGDWVLPDYLDGLASLKLGGDGSEAFQRAEKNAKGVRLPPYNPKANVLIFFEFSPGPTKHATGEYGQELRFHVPPATLKMAEFTVAGNKYPVAPTDDVWFQATTRGGRAMDHILGNKAVFKGTTDTVGDFGILAGAGTMIAGGGHDNTATHVGAGLMAAGLISKLISAATVAEADTRSWDNLPRYLSFACLPLPPGQHTLTVEFKDANGNLVPAATKTVTFEVPANGKDKVIFISDQSSTPQKT
jgi:hypothetical protein